ncbi:MAG: prolipoprotein diacylglyceryl transferase [Chitinophagaceae bacterium]|jgi:phosphatidylglycerol:prolipoprotein diacylglycerol transferase
MYPNLYFFLKEVLGIEPWTFTQYINSFGFIVAIAFIVSAFILRSELKRKEALGLLKPMEERVIVGKPASFLELATNFLFGGAVGYKMIGIFFNDQQVNPQEYIFSSQGSVIGGLLLGGLFAGLRYLEKKKQALPTPKEQRIVVWPHERVGDITVYAAISGFIGAKIFDNLENWDRFIQDPIGNLLSPSGLTFYGGLIIASITVILFARGKKIGIRHLIDSAAPALMIGYAIGRLGCHVSGDGDWGIFNSAYKVNAENKIVQAAEWEFHQTLMDNQAFTRQLVQEYGHLDSIPHANFQGWSILPNWFWAYNFPHNVNEVGTPINGCEGPYCYQLTPPVFPTTLYEIIACTVLFLLLWGVRSKIPWPGALFGLYLVLNGIERFLIEKIRVNSTYNLFGFHPTQAELIATAMIIIGGYLFYESRKRSI